MNSIVRFSKRQPRALVSRRSHNQIPQNKKPKFSKVGAQLEGAKPMDVNFRKIDIDQFDEEVLKDSELYESDSRDPVEALEDAKQKQVAELVF